MVCGRLPPKVFSFSLLEKKECNATRNTPTDAVVYQPRRERPRQARRTLLGSDARTSVQCWDTLGPKRLSFLHDTCRFIFFSRRIKGRTVLVLAEGVKISLDHDHENEKQVDDEEGLMNYV